MFPFRFILKRSDSKFNYFSGGQNSSKRSFGVDCYFAFEMIIIVQANNDQGDHYKTNLRGIEIIWRIAKEPKSSIRRKKAAAKNFVVDSNDGNGEKFH